MYAAIRSPTPVRKADTVRHVGGRITKWMNFFTNCEMNLSSTREIWLIKERERMTAPIEKANAPAITTPYADTSLELKSYCELWKLLV